MEIQRLLKRNILAVCKDVGTWAWRKGIGSKGGSSKSDLIKLILSLKDFGFC